MIALKQVKLNHALIVFLIALFLRSYIALNWSVGYTEGDGIDYHNIAVNIVNGNGYSRSTSAPFEPYFFREPSYPFFIALSYYLPNKFQKIEYLDVNRENLSNRIEIKTVRLFQAFIGALTCLIFYLIIKPHLNTRLSLIVGLAFSVYIPHAAYSTQLMREVFQTFVVMCMAFFFTKIIANKNLQWILLFSLSWAIANLTLQISIFSAPFVAFFLFYYVRNKIKSSIIFGLICLFTVLFMSPWLIRSYIFYPDIRIFKSIGSSLTYESASYSSYVVNKTRLNEIPEKEGQQMMHRWYDLSEVNKFDYSFNGTFEVWKNDAVMKYGEISLSKRINILFRYARNGWIEAFWTHEMENGKIHMRPHSIYYKEKETILLMLSILFLILSYFAIPGILMFYRFLLPILPFFFMFLFLSPLIASEPRRTFPDHPFLLMFLILFFTYIVDRLYYRYDHKNALNKMFVITNPPPAI